MSNGSYKTRLAAVRRRALAASKRPVPPSVQAYLNGTPTTSPLEISGGSAERRRFSRVAVKSEVSMRRIGGFNFQVALTNLSAGGCSVELLEAAEAGETAIARFPQLEPLGSRVCWTRGRATGVEFLTPIHPAVLDLLMSRLPAGRHRA
jgi:hypothetical protein